MTEILRSAGRSGFSLVLARYLLYTMFEWVVSGFGGFAPADTATRKGGKLDPIRSETTSIKTLPPEGREKYSQFRSISESAIADSLKNATHF
jgi:hypothetical protein